MSYEFLYNVYTRITLINKILILKLHSARLESSWADTRPNSQRSLHTYRCNVTIYIKHGGIKTWRHKNRHGGIKTWRQELESSHVELLRPR